MPTKNVTKVKRLEKSLEFVLKNLNLTSNYFSDF
jgi:hypothetical protein